MSISARSPLSLATIASACLLVCGWLALVLATTLPPIAVSLAFAAGAAVAMKSSSGATRALWFNVLFVIAAGGIAAAVVAGGDERSRRTQRFDDEAGLFQLDDTLGVRPAAGLVSRATLERDGERIYDVTYTIDDDRLRVGWPPEGGVRRQAHEPCVLFFGGSFTFGEGVEDDETLPARFAELTGLRSRNFGYSGYGPHQMLAALEAGLVEKAVACRPAHAVYQAVYHHVLRTAGRWAWDRHGPWYVLENGRAVRRGNFDDPDRPAGAGGAAAYVASGSLLGKLLGRSPDDLGVDAVTEADVALYHAVVRAAARELAARYPGIGFHVVYWDAGDSLGPYPLFRRDDLPPGARLHRITEILPPSEDWQRDYKLPHDVHPTAATHDLIARYLSDRLAPADPPEPADRRAPDVPAR